MIAKSQYLYHSSLSEDADCCTNLLLLQSRLHSHKINLKKNYINYYDLFTKNNLYGTKISVY